MVRQIVALCGVKNNALQIHNLCYYSLIIFKERSEMRECSNCGSSKCGCSWTEQLAASKQKEQERRKILREEGRPVRFDFIGKKFNG